MRHYELLLPVTWFTLAADISSFYTHFQNCYNKLRYNRFHVHGRFVHHTHSTIHGYTQVAESVYHTDCTWLKCIYHLFHTWLHCTLYTLYALTFYTTYIMQWLQCMPQQLYVTNTVYTIQTICEYILHYTHCVSSYTSHPLYVVTLYIHAVCGLHYTWLQYTSHSLCESVLYTFCITYLLYVTL